ncbi:MurR/RpiR family transcriptional regulator [Spiroplasma diminutum]|uniref:GntR family transcriptional regulator n=1 Tax=Spiroplasma diminutum CUAS-1 TaxID=1276221 RepID=S5LWR9_9MOLU|nr:MurR/RpiR family transcriptional regulator [Spiroplasma diminutum]AGR42204.1 GntR family transcriptional regulator [Spiroplasma diminutum CUAS-1]
MSNVIVKLKKIRNSDETNKNIVEFIINNLEKMDTIDIREFAKNINYSTSGVTRFIRKLGYSSFAEFKYEIKNYKKSAIFNDQDQDVKYESLSLLIEKEMTYINEILEKNYSILSNNNKIYEVTDKINLANKIFIFALGGTFTVAYDFSLKLQRLGFNAIAVNDSIIQQTLLSVNSRKDEMSLFIIFSISGETKELVTLAEKIKEKQQFLISLTGIEKNRIKELSDLNLSVFNNDKNFKSLIRGNRIPFIFLIDILIQILIEKNNVENYKSVLITAK